MAVTTVPDELPVDQAGFVDDVRAALGVWQRFPALPLLTTAFAVLAALSSSGWPGAPLAALIAFVFLAWVGSERLWYLRASPGAASRHGRPCGRPSPTGDGSSCGSAC